MTKALTRAARNDYANCSSGYRDASYYDTKGHAVRAFNAALNGHTLMLDPNDCWDFSGNEGRKTIRILGVDPNVCDDDADKLTCEGYAHLVWYRMSSGRYEFTGYCTN